MYVTHLHLHNFRNYDVLDFHPTPGLNILLGKNAQGKTSLLEAVYLLATSRSWRTPRDQELIRWYEEKARICSSVKREEQNDIEIEIILSTSDKKKILVNTINQTRLADYMGQVNVILIEPHDVDIVRGDPGNRRKFLNLEISQVQPQYCHLLAQYKRVLDQRNKLLKDMERRLSAEGLLEVMNTQLVDYGSKIMERRRAFTEQLGNIAGVLHAQITEESEDMQVKYSPSFEIDEGVDVENIAGRFRERIAELKAEELRRGVTLMGPQRDDLLFTINGVDARTFGSQGQQRTIALSLRLAEMKIMEDSAGEPPIVLLDDVMTDLDEVRRGHVFQMALGKCQTFITAATSRVFDKNLLEEGKVFKIESGKVAME